MRRAFHVLRKFCYGLLGALLAGISAFFLVIVAYLVSSEVMPVIENGSLDVETSTMILNRVWRGNEIYGLLAVYLLLAFASGYAAIRLAMRAIRR